jgi:hypothetical protein
MSKHSYLPYFFNAMANSGLKVEIPAYKQVFVAIAGQIATPYRT